LISNPNLLLLDEPTNHLDLDSLEFLISYLKKFNGAVLIVSHDKHFLKTVTSKTLGFSFGNFTLYNGDVNEFFAAEEVKRQQLISAYKNQQLKIKQIQRFIERFRYKATKAKQVQSRIKMLDKIEQVELADEEKEISFNFSNVPQSGRTVLKLNDCTKSFGENIVLDKVNLEIERGDKIAVVGVNGSGKSTLSKIIAGLENIDSGNKIIGHNVLIGYYSQNVAEGLELDKTVLETLEKVDPSKTQGELRTLLGCFLFRGDDVFKQVRVLSGGEKSRLALCKILLQKVNFLILDEPTNHLDMNSKQVLQDALIDFDGTILIVSHDVDFLDPLINKVIEVKNKKLRLFLGNVSDFLLKIEDENKNLKDSTTKTQSTDQRKLQKRIEAEKRQRFYNATKEIKKQLHEIETKIFHLEKSKKEIESLFSNPIELSMTDGKNVFNEYKEINQQLDLLYSKWEELSLEYKEIEDKFNGAKT
ncbi:MAG: ABC-F family ATP-binding cassette domain-containing protein, partial [Ignavibacteria bacterium]|nr:ABC-F family ATP-binding cassette domain-containing protein [Ignavibacteria bacterium]